MSKKERIQVQLSPETLVRVRAKTELSGEGISGYVRRLIMLDLGVISSIGSFGMLEKAAKMLHDDVGNTEKKSEPTVDNIEDSLVRSTKESFDVLRKGVVPSWKEKLEKR